MVCVHRPLIRFRSRAVFVAFVLGVGVCCSPVFSQYFRSNSIYRTPFIPNYDSKINYLELLKESDATKRLVVPDFRLSEETRSALASATAISLNGAQSALSRQLQARLESEGYRIVGSDSAHVVFHLTFENADFDPGEIEREYRKFVVATATRMGRNFHMTIPKIENEPLDLCVYSLVASVPPSEQGFYGQISAVIRADSGNTLGPEAEAIDEVSLIVDLLMPRLFVALRNFEATERALGQLSNDDLKSTVDDLVLFANPGAIPVFERMAEGKVFSIRNHLREAAKKLRKIESKLDG